MAFDQQSGPPASSKQVQELLGLLQDAGHDGFRDARGPMGFTQRQAAGKFTRDEITGLIDRLQEVDFAAEPSLSSGPNERLSPAERSLRNTPAERLASELERRGWSVTRPGSPPA